MKFRQGDGSRIFCVAIKHAVLALAGGSEGRERKCREWLARGGGSQVDGRCPWSSDGISNASYRFASLYSAFHATRSAKIKEKFYFTELRRVELLLVYLCSGNKDVSQVSRSYNFCNGIACSFFVRRFDLREEVVFVARMW